MCLNLLRVKNKKCSKDINPNCDRLYNYVPCGKCYECRELYKNEYIVRSIFHHRYYKEVLGGKTLFYTLTYNDDNLPTFNDFPCFNYKDIDHFLSRLREQIGYGKLNYFISSEYGGKTHRPHYHALFFVVGVDKYDFYEAVEKTWQNGFIYAGRNKGEVDSDDAVKYCAKYVNKDYGFEYFISDKKSFIDIDYLVKKYNKENNDGKSFKNFHLQSEGYGLYLNNFINYDNLINGCITIVTTSIRNEVKVTLSDSYPLPLYNKRKLLYKVEKNSRNNPVYRLTDYGCKIMVDMIKSKRFRFVQDFLNVRNNVDYLYNHSLIQGIYSLDEILDLFYSVDPDDLFNYHFLLRGIPMCNSFYSFDQKRFNKTLINYYKYYRKPDMLVKSDKYYDNKEFNKTLDIYFNLLNVSKYKLYCENIKSYNTYQYFRSLQSDIYKPEKLLSLREYYDMTKQEDEQKGMVSFFRYVHINKRIQFDLVNQMFIDIENNMFNALKLMCLCTKNYLKEENDLPFPMSLNLSDCPF